MRHGAVRSSAGGHGVVAGLGADAFASSALAAIGPSDYGRRAGAARAPTCRRRAIKDIAPDNVPRTRRRDRAGEARERRRRGHQFGARRPTQRQDHGRPTHAAVADKLREQLAAGKFDRILGGKKDRATVEAFYSSRDFAPLWIADGAMSERAKAAAAYLAGVDADGLDPADYPLPQIKAGAEPDALAEAEIKFTDAVLTFARHAMSGRVHYSRVAADIVYDLAKPDPADVLAKLAKAAGRRRGARQLQPAAAAVQGAQGQARRDAQGRRRRREADDPVRSGAEVRQGQEGQGRKRS